MRNLLGGNGKNEAGLLKLNYFNHLFDWFFSDPQTRTRTIETPYGNITTSNTDNVKTMKIEGLPVGKLIMLTKGDAGAGVVYINLNDVSFENVKNISNPSISFQGDQTISFYATNSTVYATYVPSASNIGVRFMIQIFDK